MPEGIFVKVSYDSVPIVDADEYNLILVFPGKTSTKYDPLSKPTIEEFE